MEKRKFVREKEKGVKEEKGKNSMYKIVEKKREEEESYPYFDIYK